MAIRYQEYTRSAIKAAPFQLWVGQWRIDYLAFSHPDNAHKPPLLVVGGAFQNFTSYKYCVERIYQDFPVVLVDLPSLGNNTQIAPDLSMEDLADLLYEFTCQSRLEKVHLMGLSLGSAVASTFAYKYPRATEKLIVAGIVTRPRKSWRMLVEESVRVLEQGRMDEFSQAVVLYLVNYDKMKETGITPTARKLFYRQMKQLSDNERERYKINGRRLLSVEGLLGYPECDTLVTTGEFDSFTLPWENASFAEKCPNAQFTLIKGADHLPQLEKREVSLDLFSTFLRGESLERVQGIRRFGKGEYQRIERRRAERLVPCNNHGYVTSESRVGDRFRFNKPVQVVDINFFGCLIKLSEPGFSIADHARDCTLYMESPELKLELLVFDYDDAGYLRCLFKHGNIQAAERFTELLKNSEYFLHQDSEGNVHRIYG
ncbi:MAG: alpha/beta hydrolase [Alcanivorax sp.]|jgi:pimeloyl-ACP methyl ester carboxylesterase|uniref:alpha/beta fold hydrolase n=1 Tax=unclassified Alcanivorax TaxID=2638842 RepID=UPI0008A0037E|nr:MULTISPECIES: alpha/beta hydrolase [unclassified Alcanivorax]MBB10912.1 alpha/beta hydrolase [Alcanivorax sp.]MBU84934.1 alpha/beta hydrolase [Alcanivorax sp.]MEE3322287.1 alpha/beta hydrolase [Pseudomonadota bacterium]SEF96366.1 Pimeloyl-ACP methyl ester carboxylesterase [Alcanivorax sp. DSM 26293]